ncbi:D-glucuronyl C5-epimerase family protein [Lishizhenia sp.]|uniref:D-glucuronyl C5-epimerase family protein n=1 Tax=Lishizhenia sp. TaxID=2497594 RepID=UPI00299EFF4D|nr:D-glucuronyl C5-epimerase family protein [Lishizhenia sp.]
MIIFRKELLSLLTLFLCLNFTFGQTLKRYSCIVDRIDLHEMEGNRTLDSTGILLSNYRYHPLSISQFGVLSYYYFKDTGDSIYYKKCVDQIKYFKDTSKVHSLFNGKGMGLPYNYNFWDLKAPWYSGMTQGYAVSYLLRYYDLTQDEEVLPIIEKVAYVLLQNQEDGGTISKTPEGYTWIEEYPNSNRSPQVLNGYINGLIGLKEYCDFHPNDTMAKRIFDETYEGFTNSLHHFDTHMWSYYNRKNRGLSNKYMRYQIYEMKHLYELFGDEIFDNQRRIWSVMANKKYIKSKSKAYKFPNHDLVFPVNKISDSLLGRILPSPLEVHKEDQLYSSTLQLSNREKRKMKRKMKTECLFTPHTDSLKTANYLEIHHSTFNAQSNLAIYHRNAKNKLVPLATEIIATKGKIKISFALTEVSDLVIGLQGFNL